MRDNTNIESTLEPLYSVEDIKNYTHLSYESIRKFIREKKLVASKMGVKYMVKESELKRFIDERTTKQ